MIRRVMALLGALALAASAVTLASSPSQAVTDSWAGWGPITGSSNDYTTTMSQRSPGFPVATVRSDSRANVALPSGQSTFLSGSTPPGAKYGSSAGNAYLNLRPKADTSSTPSRTTYTFDGSTPDTGWAFVLGDVDADSVRIEATDESGEAVDAATIDAWRRGEFNYANSPQEVPTWDAGTSTLTGRAGFADTNGASGWFEPTTKLSSLTFTFTRLAGFPVYQTWFVSRARPVTGTVSLQPVTGAEPCATAGKTVRLLTADGRTVATTTTTQAGTYTFGEVATRDDYVVRLETGDDCRTDDAQVPADNEGDDGDPASVADFTVRGLVPEPISGRVVDDDGAPLAGVQLTLTPPGGGATSTTTTDGDGRYVFDANPAGTGYEVTVTAPTGYTPVDPTLDGITVVVGQASDANDFELRADPSVSGTVTGGGGPLGGVQVTLTPDGGGTPLTTVTGPDGAYVFDRVDPTTYSISVDVPDGYDAEPARTGVQVAAGDVTGQDFALARPGAIGGRVVDEDGAGVAGVEVVVDGPGAPETVTTDGDGSYFLDGLDAGSYTVTPTVPEGQQVRGEASSTVSLTAAGEVAGGQDFVLVPVEIAPPTEPTTPPGGGGDDDGGGDDGSGAGDDDADADPGADAGSDGLPDTGGPSRVLTVLGGTLVAGGLVVVGGSALVRRRRS